MLRQSFFAGLISLGLAAVAQAGPLYVYVVADPATTAGAGVAASNTMTVSSNRSGAGTFHVYAVDDVAGSFGIKSYNIKLNGVLTALTNRSPNGTWTDADDVSSPQGFNDVRTATFATGTTSGGQGPTNPVFITGIGSAKSDFPTNNTVDVSSAQAGGAAGQWGTYSATLGANTSGLINGVQKYAVLLAEGAYTGAIPTVDLVTASSLGGTAVNLLSSQTGGAAFSVTQFSTLNPFAGPVIPEPATLTLVGLAVLGMCGLRRRS